MNSFFRFMVTKTGCIIRIVAGMVLIVIGICWVQGVAGWIMVITGLVPLVAGIFDKCVFAELINLIMDRSELRERTK